MPAKYLNPFTDFGFKKLFGEEASKPLLMDFLNQLLPIEAPIVTLEFRNPEQLGISAYDRKAIFDLYCTDERGRHFIVEVQKAKQNFFKDRAVFYSTFPIQKQAEQGEWDFRLAAVYCVGLLDFVFEEDKELPDYLHEVKLKNQRHTVFYDKLTFFFIEMPKFRKAEAELADRLDKWLYFLKHLEEFAEIPATLNEPIFRQGFERAALAVLSPQERDQYEESLKVYRDLNNVIDTARQEGLEQGLEQGRAEGERLKQEAIARQMKQDGLPVATIARYTGLGEATIQDL